MKINAAMIIHILGTLSVSVGLRALGIDGILYVLPCVLCGTHYVRRCSAPDWIQRLLDTAGFYVRRSGQ